MNSSLTRFLIGAVVACGMCLAPWTAEAALLSYEGFSYSGVGGDLVGNNGGQGWSGAWAAGGFNASINTNFDIANGSLQFPPLLAEGNRTSTLPQNAISGAVRSFSQPIGAGDTVTRYLSVLLRPEVTLGGGTFDNFFGLYLDGNGVNGDDVFIGKGGGGVLNRWVVETRGGGGQVASTVAPALNQTALLVLKAQFTPGNEIFTLYVNPIPGQPEPTFGALKTDLNIGNVSGLALYSTGGFSADEIRWGETFADVTPIPEPATWLLVGVGGVCLALRRVAMRREKVQSAS